MSYKIILKQRNVNSRKFASELDDFVRDCIASLEYRWTSDLYRESFVSILEDWMQELGDDGKVIQYDIVCDNRNNTPKTQREGKFFLTVKYKQTHCLNTSALEYAVIRDVASKDSSYTFKVLP